MPLPCIEVSDTDTGSIRSPTFFFVQKLGRVWVAFSLFGIKELADLLPHVISLYSVIINIVGRPSHRDAHLSDVRVSVLFRISSAGCLGLHENQKHSLERSAFRIDTNI